MSNSALKHFYHIFVDNKANKTLFLLHGTGGSEHDLIPLVTSLKSKYNFVGLKGNVNEQGLQRFFYRNPAGVFDQESIKEETKKFSEFISAWCKEQGQELADLAFVGFSNGANMILATMFYYPELIHKAVLLHPILPFQPAKELSLAGKELLLTYGEHDEMISAEKSRELIEILNSRGADVQIVHHQGGHRVQREEVEKLVEFL
jgi:phospholipase/carboxylesterase